MRNVNIIKLWLLGFDSNEIYNFQFFWLSKSIHLKERKCFYFGQFVGCYFYFIIKFQGNG